jgi:alkylation response protein AidB-like acyl-CoA dehydrogenase
MSEPSDLIERARALQPLIMHEADEIERTRRLTRPVVTALIENGLYRMMLPRSLGGSEIPLASFMQVVEEVAKADASTAWCLGQNSVCAMVSAYMDHDAAKKIWAAPTDILAWGSIGGQVRVAQGGYQATGRWEFASGMRQASWLGAHVFVVEADGQRRRKRDGSPEVRTILFPASSATLYDVWNVIGLKGTGTDSYSVDNLFISEEFAAFRDEPSALREQGPLYKIPSMFVYAMGFAAVSLGVARAMLDSFGELARGKTSFGQKPMRDNNAVQAQLGRNEGNLRAARAYLYSTANEIWHDVAWVGERTAGQFTDAHRTALRLASTWTIHQSAAVVDATYHLAGSTAVFQSGKFERRFRDMHAIAQQLQGRDTHYETVGQSILGVDANARGSN